MVVAGGGTAGHLLPGLAVAEELVQRGHPRSAIQFVGAKHGPEAALAPAAGFQVEMLPGRGIQRRFTLQNLAAVAGLLMALVRGAVLVRRRKPSVVLALGGYASVACTIGAWLWRVPIVVTEQNARAGLASRLAGLLGASAAVPFAETDLPRAVVTGTPVRSEVLAAARRKDPAAAKAALGIPGGRRLIAVFSGSLGSRHLNSVVADLSERWSGRSDLAIHHVVGRRDWGSLGPVPEGREVEGLWYRRVQYEDRMELLLAAADVAVCRAGGTTVAELASMGLPSVLVPLPGAPRDHQTANAACLVRGGASVLVPDAELDPDRLGGTIDDLLSDDERLTAMGARAAEMARPDAAARVADLVESLAGERRRSGGGSA